MTRSPSDKWVNEANLANQHMERNGHERYVFLYNNYKTAVRDAQIVLVICVRTLHYLGIQPIQGPSGTITVNQHVPPETNRGFTMKQALWQHGI